MGLISKTKAKELRALEVAAGRRSSGPGDTRGRAPGASGDSQPQLRLFEALEAEWPGRFEWEYRVKFEGMRQPYRLDMAVPEQKLAVEVDGWQYHGRVKRDFQRDRIRQNRLAVNGWRILRYFPGQIYSDIDRIVSEVGVALTRGRV